MQQTWFLSFNQKRIWSTVNTNKVFGLLFPVHFHNPEIYLQHLHSEGGIVDICYSTGTLNFCSRTQHALTPPVHSSSGSSSSSTSTSMHFESSFLIDGLKKMQIFAFVLHFSKMKFLLQLCKICHYPSSQKIFFWQRNPKTQARGDWGRKTSNPDPLVVLFCHHGDESKLVSNWWTIPLRCHYSLP